MEQLTLDERTLGKMEKLTADLCGALKCSARIIALAILRRGFSEDETIRHLRVLEKKLTEEK